MRKNVILIFIMIWVSLTLTRKVIPLPDLLKPESIQLDEKQFYISEGTSIYIYNLDNFKLVKKIGKEGEGPKEFKILPFLPQFVNITDKHMIGNFT